MNNIVFLSVGSILMILRDRLSMNVINYPQKEHNREI